MDIKDTLAEIRTNIEEGKYKKHTQSLTFGTEPSAQELAEEHLQAEMERNARYQWDAKYEMI